ncbi:MAG: zinc-binding dehydrogenase [Acidobacteria bacterium]|nr:zinc-binding dehydrogenase [Acidobacteriota bacterium]
MLAVHLESGRVSVRRVPKPGRPPGYSLIRMLAAGICNTDLELQRGYYGFRGRPGHEFVGEVAESDTAELVGRRVVGEINLACECCAWCARGLGRHCPKRTVLGIVRHPGAFAEFLTLPDRNLHLVPDRVPVQHAVFTEPVGAACEVLDQVKIPRGTEVAVLGDGKLGLLTAQVLQLHGARVVQVGRHREKLRIAEALGVTGQIRGARLPTAEFDVVIEATGSADGLAAAAKMVRPRGTVVLKSTVHGTAQVETAPLVVNEITLVGSRCGRFAPALKLIRQGKLNLDPMVTDELALSEAERAFEDAGRKGVLKVLLRN